MEESPSQGAVAARQPAGSEPGSAHTGKTWKAYEVLTAVSMIFGRGKLARAVANAARVAPGDRVLDIGCGPGTAAREAARRAAAATGVDPSPTMLRLAHWISAIRPPGNVSWLEGSAERLPLPDGQATVAWAISSAHHWSDRAAAFSEARRALAPGGRLVIAERLVDRGTRRHAAHGMSSDQASELAREMTAIGFADVQVRSSRAGRRNLVIVSGAVPPTGFEPVPPP
jgi:ubiquinone/menaquinone biosynthesis C-methylase UbiE